VLCAAMETNVRQREIVAGKLCKTLGELRDKEIAVLGLAFKPGTDEVVDAPAVEIVKKLAAAGSRVRVTDPAAGDSLRQLLPPEVIFADGIYSAAKNAHAVLLLTEWPEFIAADWAKIKQDMKEPCALVDARNALAREVMTQLGYKYTGVGRGSMGKR
jgi:UDPglucose 6-dehydrogenase